MFGLDNLTYDANGNINSLTRTFQNAVVDNLAYSYGASTNRLSSVNDGGSNPGAPNAFFKDGTANYSYDANGNLISDSGKGISGIDYTYLNLPSAIHKSGGDISYTYSASGQKLKADFGSGKVYDYIAGLVYDKDGLEFIPTAEGRVLPPGRASTAVTIGANTTVVASNQFYRYEYQLRDHLGNLRSACRCGERASETTPSETYAPLVVQEQHYDPFGLDLTGLSSQPGITASRFKYNGKEEQMGLGWIDYGARLYDPSNGRWSGVDPHAEKYEAINPYSYGFDNPIRFVDLQGKDPGDVIVIFAGANLFGSYRGIPIPAFGAFPNYLDYLGTAKNIQDQIREWYTDLNGGNAKAFESDYYSTINGVTTTRPELSIEEAYEYVKMNYQVGGRIIIYGYSYGGVLAQALNKKLKGDNLNVRLEILVDPAKGENSAYVDNVIQDNVQEAYTYYQTALSTGIHSRGYPSNVQDKQKTNGTNTKVSYVRDKNGKFVNASHSNIDDALLQIVVNQILNVLNQHNENEEKSN